MTEQTMSGADQSSAQPARVETHEHHYISGPNVTDGSRPGGAWHDTKFTHSHVDGSTGHAHPDCGPSAFTVDKDEWYAVTGLRGGGRKSYTTKPDGPQLEYRELEAWQRTFKVVMGDGGGSVPKARKGEPGRGGAAVARLALGFGIEPTCEYEDGRS